MFKKRDFVLILILSFALILSMVFWIYNRESFSVGGIRAEMDNNNKIIFISLPEGSETEQKLSFNFPFKNNDVYIKDISHGTKNLDNPKEERLENDSFYDFKDFIAHSKLIIKSNNSQIEYDLWVTTGDLPIITIETNGDITDEPKIDSSFNILSKTKSQILKNIPGEIELINNEEEVQKKSYSLNIIENQITGSMPQILDFEESKRFKLSSCSSDSSFLREKLSYDLFKMFSNNNIAPESNYTEVYLNGSYQGLYLLSRRADRNMFSIENYDENDSSHSVIYEASNWRADFSRGVKGFTQVEPDMDNDRSYYEPLEILSNQIASDEEDDIALTIEDTFNMDNLIDSHILFLFTASDNELAPFQYIYRDNKPDSKFNLSPGDYYNSSFGINENSIVVNSGNSFFGNRLFNKLYLSDDYRDKLNTRWKELRKNILNIEIMEEIINENTLLISEAQDRNNKKWFSKRSSLNNPVNLDDEVVFIKDFINVRLDWLDNYFIESPYFKIGDTYALINEEKKTIFCALPQGSDVTQMIETNIGNEMYIEPIIAGNFEFYLDDFDEYRDEIENFGINNNKIYINIDKLEESDLLDGEIIVSGWAVDFSNTSNPGVKAIYVFDGPQRDKQTFLGKVNYGTLRNDVGKFYQNVNYNNSGFEHNINTNLLKNGKHTLFLYALDESNNYTIEEVEIEIENDVSIVAEMNESFQSIIISGDDYNFADFIFHGDLLIEGKGTYDFWVTTGDISIMTIDTSEEEIKDEPRTECKIQILSGTDLNDYNTELLEAEIEIRGIASSSYPKKSYNLVLQDNVWGDAKKELIGSYKSNKWSLNASYYDRSFMRNKLSFDIFNELFNYGHEKNIAPVVNYIEVYINGSYNGLYFISEKVNRDLLGIERYTEDDINSSVIYKAIGPDANYSLYRSEGTYKDKLFEGYELVYPDPDNLVYKDTYYARLEDYIRLIATKNISEIEKEIDGYIDLDNLIDFYLLIQLTCSYDGIFKNQFLYKDYGEDSKIKYSPWDYDETFGQQDQLTSGGAYDKKIDSPFFNKLLQIDMFKMKVKNRWEELRSSSINSNNIIEMIKDNDSLIHDAQGRNFKKYPVREKEHYPQDYYTHEYDIEFMKEWINNRINWVDNYFNNL